ncbi:MAG TPA: polymer-forming cytoskeletal protein [Steroidobacteraceae bacterium]|jgi:cytoskeletal protein CcmA (bactofilin family)|nr:polymer-forming cytoskeletal protein [Steroidobacteraceae bacterium]
MALWNEKPTPANAGPAVPSTAPPPERSSPERNSAERAASDPALAVSPRRPTPKTSAEGGESVIAANLNIEGKIEGSGNVRMAGRFKGDVRIDGNFSIESGAHLTGQVLAAIVVVGGELQGNIENAKRVDVQEGGVIVGDVKAGSITVAAGSRMRGHVEFGWEDEKVKIKPGLVGSGS